MAGVQQDFVAVIDGWVNRTIDDLAGVVREAIEEMAGIAIDLTPVRTGVLAGSYNGEGVGKEASKARIAAQLASLEPGAVFSFYNNTEYMEYIELGTDKIRPFAMMQQAAAAWPQCVDRAVARRARS